VYSFDGSFGNPGLIPTNGGTQGQSYQKTYTLTVPTPTNSASLYNSDNLYIVAFLAEYNSNQNNRNVLNVVKQKITPNSEILGVQEEQGNSFISLFPNPSNQSTMLLFNLLNTEDLNIAVYDLTGKIILHITKEIKQKGNQTININTSILDSGIYMCKIQSNNGERTIKLTVTR
jgi:hypothetical protein